MFLRRILCIWIAISFLGTSVIPPQKVYAQTILGLPEPGVMVNLSPAFEPTLIKGLTVHKDNPFLFDFIVDTGHSNLAGDELKKEGDRLVKYFFACLTVPEKDLWVNLSPYEKDRMVPDALGKTALGRDLLAQDYILKQLTASLIYPEKDLGKEFWNRVYAKAQAMYGNVQIPVNTFNKVWILADKATVYEHGQTAFVVGGHLKVMLEEDYKSAQKHNKPTDSISSQIVRDVVLPEIEKEVNTGKNFANLRQIFNSLILASWYKKNLKEALINQVYSDKNTVKGINLSDPSVKEKIYQQYLQAYKKGVFNYIKEDAQTNGQSIPRKYFSGGFAANPAMLSVVTDPVMVSRMFKGVSTLVVLSTALFLNQPSIASDDITDISHPLNPANPVGFYAMQRQIQQQQQMEEENKVKILNARIKELSRLYAEGNFSKNYDALVEYFEYVKDFNTQKSIIDDIKNCGKPKEDYLAFFLKVANLQDRNGQPLAISNYVLKDLYENGRLTGNPLLIERYIETLTDFEQQKLAVLDLVMSLSKEDDVKPALIKLANFNNKEGQRPEITDFIIKTAFIPNYGKPTEFTKDLEILTIFANYEKDPLVQARAILILKEIKSKQITNIVTTSILGGAILLILGILVKKKLTKTNYLSILGLTSFIALSQNSNPQLQQIHKDITQAAIAQGIDVTKIQPSTLSPEAQFSQLQRIIQEGITSDAAMTVDKRHIELAKNYMSLLERVEAEKDFDESSDEFSDRLSSQFDLEDLLYSGGSNSKVFSEMLNPLQSETSLNEDFSGYLLDEDGDIWLITKKSPENSKKLYIVRSTRTIDNSSDYSTEGGVAGFLVGGVSGAVGGYLVGSLFDDGETVRRSYSLFEWDSMGDILSSNRFIGYITAEDLKALAQQDLAMATYDSSEGLIPSKLPKNSQPEPLSKQNIDQDDLNKHFVLGENVTIVNVSKEPLQLNLFAEAIKKHLEARAGLKNDGQKIILENLRLEIHGSGKHRGISIYDAAMNSDGSFGLAPHDDGRDPWPRWWDDHGDFFKWKLQFCKDQRLREYVDRLDSTISKYIYNELIKLSQKWVQQTTERTKRGTALISPEQQQTETDLKKAIEIEQQYFLSKFGLKLLFNEKDATWSMKHETPLSPLMNQEITRRLKEQLKKGDKEIAISLNYPGNDVDIPTMEKLSVLADLFEKNRNPLALSTDDDQNPKIVAVFADYRKKEGILPTVYITRKNLLGGDAAMMMLVGTGFDNADDNALNVMKEILANLERTRSLTYQVFEDPTTREKEMGTLLWSRDEEPNDSEDREDDKLSGYAKDFIGLLATHFGTKVLVEETPKPIVGKEGIKIGIAEITQYDQSKGPLVTQVIDFIKQTIAEKESDAAMASWLAPEFRVQSGLFKGLPQAVLALKERDLTGVRILLRTNQNVPLKDGVIADTTRLEESLPILKFLLERGADVVLIGHHGRGDDSKSLEPTTQFFQERFPDVSVKFYPNSINKEGLSIKAEDLSIDATKKAKGSIHILENVRLASDFEQGEKDSSKRKQFSEGLAQLADVLILDAYADIDSKGASIEDLPAEFIRMNKEFFVGPSMVKEAEKLSTLVQSGVSAVVMGGVKPDKIDPVVSILEKTLPPNGFILLGSAPSSRLDHTTHPLSLDSRTAKALDFSPEGTTHDIGPETISLYKQKLESLQPGQNVIVNGTMGWIENKNIAGTKEIFTKLKEIAQRGVNVIFIGGDASANARLYGLEGAPNVSLITGGGVVLKLAAGKKLVGVEAMKKALPDKAMVATKEVNFWKVTASSSKSNAMEILVSSTMARKGYKYSIKSSDKPDLVAQHIAGNLATEAKDGRANDSDVQKIVSESSDDNKAIRIPIKEDSDLAMVIRQGKDYVLSHQKAVEIATTDEIQFKRRVYLAMHQDLTYIINSTFKLLPYFIEVQTLDGTFRITPSESSRNKVHIEFAGADRNKLKRLETAVLSALEITEPGIFSIEHVKPDVNRVLINILQIEEKDIVSNQTLAQLIGNSNVAGGTIYNINLIRIALGREFKITNDNFRFIGTIKISELYELVSKFSPADAGATVDNALVAKLPPGGIDLNSNNMSMTITKDASGGVKVDFDPALIERIRQEGVQSVTPVIINMTPVVSIWPLLGLKEPEEQERLAKV